MSNDKKGGTIKARDVLVVECNTCNREQVLSPGAYRHGRACIYIDCGNVLAPAPNEGES